MKTITILTPGNVEVEYRLAGAGSRLAAFIIDFSVQVLAMLLMLVTLLRLDNGRLTVHVEGNPLAFVIIAWFVIYFCYFLFAEMLTNGQSIGKKIFGLRAIRDNGEPVGMVQVLIRGLFRAVLDSMYIGIISIFISKKHKRIGDMVAGTIVVAEQAHKLTPLLPAERNLKLTEEEQALMQLYQARKDTLPDGGTALRVQWLKYLSKKWEISPAEAEIEFFGQVNHGTL